MTEPIVRTVGRRMSRNLERALDDLTGPARAAAIKALQTSENHVLSRLHHALALELTLAEALQESVLARLSDDHRASIPEPPMPQAQGTAWTPDDTA